MVNELVEAQHHNLLGRTLGRWSRYDLIVLDEVGYVTDVCTEVGARATFPSDCGKCRASDDHSEDEPAVLRIEVVRRSSYSGHKTLSAPYLFNF
jgi:hypothetical protein